MLLTQNSQYILTIDQMIFFSSNGPYNLIDISHISTRNKLIKYALFHVQMNALKNLGLNVVKASVCLDSTGKHNKFAITKAYVNLLSYDISSDM